jgi:hypothetical protein
VPVRLASVLTIVIGLTLSTTAWAAQRRSKESDDDTVGRVRPKVLLLPAQGPADEPSRRELNKRLREALQRDETISLMDGKATADVLDDSKSMGLVCKPSDGECLIKLGVLADVAMVLVPQARGRRSLQVEVGLWEVETGAEVRHVQLELAPSDAEMVDLLVDRAFGRSAPAPTVGDAIGSGDIKEPKTVAPGCVEGSLDCPRSVGKVDEVAEEGPVALLPWVGVGVAGLGGVALLGGVIGGSFSEVRAIGLAEDPVTNAAELQGIAAVGGALWVTAIAGGVVTAGGMALWWFTREADAAPADDQLVVGR